MKMETAFTIAMAALWAAASVTGFLVFIRHVDAAVILWSGVLLLPPLVFILLAVAFQRYVTTASIVLTGNVLSILGGGWFWAEALTSTDGIGAGLEFMVMPLAEGVACALTAVLAATFYIGFRRRASLSPVKTSGTNHYGWANNHVNHASGDAAYLSPSLKGETE